MLRALLVTGTILCLLSAYSQDTVNQVDAEGRKQGYWKKYNREGILLYVGQFRDDTPYGTFTYYYPSGKTRTLSHVSGQGGVAFTTSWFPNGRMMARGKYVDQQRDSLWQFFSEYDGSLVSEEWYVNGRKNGTEKIYFPGKGVSEVISWKDGVKEGIWEQFYDDGTLKLRGSYVHDEKEGPLTTYFATGKILAAGHYRRGHQDGTWIYYDEKGKVTLKEYYEGGILVKTEEFNGQ